jgi:hypothetical protein
MSWLSVQLGEDMTALLTYSQWTIAEPSVANSACNGFSMMAWGQSRPIEAIDFEPALTSAPDVSLRRTK